MSKKNHKKKIAGRSEVNTAAAAADKKNGNSAQKPAQTDIEDSMASDVQEAISASIAEMLNDDDAAENTTERAQERAQENASENVADASPENAETVSSAVDSDNDEAKTPERGEKDKSDNSAEGKVRFKWNNRKNRQAKADKTVKDEKTLKEEKPQKEVNPAGDKPVKKEKTTAEETSSKEEKPSKKEMSSKKDIPTKEEIPAENSKNRKVTDKDSRNIKEAAAKTTEARKKLAADNERAKEIDERRAARHKRRIRNQIISYVVVALFVIIVGAAAYWGLNRFVLKNNNTSATDETNVAVEDTTSEQTDEIINDMIGDETEIEKPVVEETVAEEPVEETNPLDDYVEGIISSMTLEEKVAGLFITTPESITGVNLATVAGDGTKSALEKYAVGGLIYSQRNITSEKQFSDMISKTLTMVKYPTFIAIAEEGGKNSPLANAGYYDAQSNASEIRASNDVTAAYSAGVTIGLAMKDIGFNLDLAPVADISSVSGNILGSRCFADTAIDASEYVNSYFTGLEDSGITACLKYFPGLGCVTGDPASDRVVCDRSQDDFSSGELLVYQSAIENGANMIMISNAVYSAYDDSAPASLSESVVTGILREQLGYDGIVVSGNLSDAAISNYYGADEAAIAALKAGCDMLQCPEDFSAAYEGLIAAVNDGHVDEERVDDALTRILRVKYADTFEE